MSKVIQRGSVSDYGSTPELSYEESYLAAVMEERRRRKKKRLISSLSLNTFHDVYSLSGDVLGEGSTGKVMTGVNNLTGEEVAVKCISKGGDSPFFSREKVLREVELYYMCRGVTEIVQLLEYFEEEDAFYLIFEKAQGGPLFDHLQGSERRLSQSEAKAIVRDLSKALAFLHKKGVAHRDLKPENVLCVKKGSPYPVKLCDFDLCSGVVPYVSTPSLSSPVGSAEYMAPEVVNLFMYSSMDDEDYFLLDEEEDNVFTYDKKCDLWSLGVLVYILVTGTMPFRGKCANGDSCLWNAGGECPQCQRTLFQSIKSGVVHFPPDNNNKPISNEAKDLILSLLVKDPSNRLPADCVATHPWLSSGVSVHKKSFADILRSSATKKKDSPILLIHPEDDDNHKSKL